MKLTRCILGHYYDMEKFSCCPHCSAPILPDLDKYAIKEEDSSEDFSVVPSTPNGLVTYPAIKEEDSSEDFSVGFFDAKFFTSPNIESTETTSSNSESMETKVELPEELSLFDLGEKIGEGSSGAVYRLHVKQDYAVKIIPKYTERLKNFAENEYIIGTLLNESNYFPHFYGKFETKDNIFLVQDLRITLKEYANQFTFNRTVMMKVVKDILIAIIDMQNKGILHMDIKRSNIFVDNSNRGCLGDFSHSMQIGVNLKHKELIGTYPYIAPEVFAKAKVTGKEDMFSFGILLYRLFTGGKMPFPEEFRENPSLYYNEYAVLDDENIPESMMKIIRKCCALRPEERYTSYYELLGVYIEAMEKLQYDSDNQPMSLGEWDEFITANTFGFEISEEKPTMEMSQTKSDLKDCNREIPKRDIYREERRSNFLKIDEVEFSVFTDRSIRGDDYGIVEIMMYLEEQRQSVLERMQDEFNGQMKEKQFPSMQVGREQKVTIRLSSKAVEIDDDSVVHSWRGKELAFTFDYYVPENYKRTRIPFDATVSFDGVPATRLKFYVDIERGKRDVVEKKTACHCDDIQRIDIKKAFASYASQDRARVTAILQGMKTVRPDLDIFLDVEKLRAGTDWENKLYRELSEREMLFLCWSHFAMNSEWVKKEWKFMLQQKGLAAIEPIPMEDLSFCPPPEELKTKHFNDLLLQYRNKPVLLAEDFDW